MTNSISSDKNKKTQKKQNDLRRCLTFDTFRLWRSLSENTFTLHVDHKSLFFRGTTRPVQFLSIREQTRFLSTNDDVKRHR